MLSFTSSHYAEIQSFLQDCYDSMESDCVLSEQSTHFLLQIYTFSKNKQFPQLLEVNELLKLGEHTRQKLGKQTTVKRSAVKHSPLRTEVVLGEAIPAGNWSIPEDAETSIDQLNSIEMMSATILIRLRERYVGE